MVYIRQLLDPFLESLGLFLPSVVGALLLFLAGFLLASLVRKGLIRLLAAINLNERLAAGTGETVGLEQFIVNLCYYIILLGVLLLTLDVLGVQDVFLPVREMFAKLFGVVPNMVTALLIGYVGYVIARLVSSAVEVVSKGLDSVSVKVGLSSEFSISRLLARLTFLLIFVPVLISALDALKIDAISVPSTQMLSAILMAIPKLFAATLILAIAYTVGRFVTSIATELLQNIGLDAVPEKIGIHGIVGDKTSFSRLCGGITFYFIMLAAAVAAVEQLSMPQLSQVLGEFLLFSGQIVLGLIVLAVGNFTASLAYKALTRTADNKGLATIARIAILGLVLAMGLRAMGIADDIVNLAFGLTLGSVAVTVALAFGLGGREAAGRQMEYWLSRLREPDAKKQEEQKEQVV